MISLEQRVTVGTDFETTIERFGDSGPAILMIHGIGSSRRDATRLGRALETKARVYAYDQPCHGDSADARGPLLLAELAVLAQSVIDSIGHIDFLIGHSWGGAVAAITAVNTGIPVLLIDPLLHVEPGTFHEFVEDLQTLLADPPGEARDHAVRAEYASADPVDIEAKVHALHALDPNQVARLGAENDVESGGWNVLDVLDRMTIPPCLALADEDSVMSAADRVRIPADALVRVFAGHGHTLHRTAFAEFTALVEKFFEL